MKNILFFTTQEKNSCNGLILKLNQIWTATETLQAVKLAKAFDWKIMAANKAVANKAGETKDDFITDLAVGIGAEFIKSRAPFLLTDFFSETFSRR